MFYYWIDELCCISHFIVDKSTIEVWLAGSLTIEQIVRYST